MITNIGGETWESHERSNILMQISILDVKNHTYVWLLLHPLASNHLVIMSDRKEKPMIEMLISLLKTKFVIAKLGFTDGGVSRGEGILGFCVYPEYTEERADERSKI